MKHYSFKKFALINIMSIIALTLLIILIAKKISEPSKPRKSIMEQLGEGVRDMKTEFDKGYNKKDTLKKDTLTLKQ